MKEMINICPHEQSNKHIMYWQSGSDDWSQNVLGGFYTTVWERLGYMKYSNQILCVFMAAPFHQMETSVMSFLISNTLPQITTPPFVSLLPKEGSISTCSTIERPTWPGPSGWVWSTAMRLSLSLACHWRRGSTTPKRRRNWANAWWSTGPTLHELGEASQTEKWICSDLMNSNEQQRESTAERTDQSILIRLLSYRGDEVVSHRADQKLHSLVTAKQTSVHTYIFLIWDCS